VYPSIQWFIVVYHHVPPKNVILWVPLRPPCPELPPAPIFFKVGGVPQIPADGNKISQLLPSETWTRAWQTPAASDLC